MKRSPIKRRSFPHRRAVRTCTVCDSKFQTPPSSGPRKTCSPACANEAKRRSKVGAKNPHYNGGISARKRRWRAARGRVCAVCGINDLGCRIVRHHVVYEQHVRKYGGDEWNPADGLDVCFDCHNAHHHNADGRIPVSVFTPENLAFARELLGDYMPDYFSRFYEVDVSLV